MNCQQAQALLQAAIDDELDAVHQLELEEHVTSCPECAGIRETALALRSSVRGANLYYEAPAGLERRIARAVRPSGSRWLTGRLEAPARALSAHRTGFAASVAAVVLALALGVALGRRSAAPLLADELVDNHIRSLMPGHLTDEASSEHHTVKPWFAGRLDFSPEVPDLAAAGFTLAGARVDYAGGRPVAALVYRRRQHVINLFVWPAGGEAATGSAEGSRRGYNFVRGRAGPNEMWAVSDLNASELREFVRLVERGR